MHSEIIIVKKAKQALNLWSSRQVRDLFEIGLKIIEVNAPDIEGLFPF
jgi:hypothetical protein